MAPSGAPDGGGASSPAAAAPGGASSPAAAASGTLGAAGASATAAEALQAVAQAAYDVEEAFSEQRLAYSNLLVDLGATDSWLLDGDSLLLELISGDRVDWAHGGQFGQLTAQAEQFLAALARANSDDLSFSIVFFDSNAAAQPDAGARLARAVLQRWLPERLGVPVLRFSSWWGKDWASYLREAHPALLIMSDLPQAAASASAGTSTSISISAQLYMQAFMLHSGAHLQVALLPEMQFAEDFVYGFRTRWHNTAHLSARTAAAQEAAATVGRAFTQQQRQQQQPPADQQHASDSDGSFSAALAGLEAASLPASLLAGIAQAPPGQHT